MKITAVETCVVSLPFDMGGPKPAFAGKPWTTLDVLIVKVETEDGLIGWGEAFGHAAIPATKAAIDTIVAPLVLGRDAGDLNGLSRQISHSLHLLGRNGSFLYGWSGIEIALWDLAGKRAGQPLYRLLGGRDPGPMDGYASLLNYGDDALVSKNTADACAAGYRFIKLHEVSRPAVLAAQRVANDAAIMLDVNCAWSPQVAREMAASLAGDGLYWLEEPIWPPEDVHGLASIRAYGIPISAGENVAGVFGFKSLIEAAPSTSPSRASPRWAASARCFDLCEAHGVAVAPHSPYFGPGFVTTLHIAAARMEKPLIEVLWLEMEANPFDPWVRAKDGKLCLPHGPGLGCEPDLDVLRRYQVGETIRNEWRAH